MRISLPRIFLPLALQAALLASGQHLSDLSTDSVAILLQHTTQNLPLFIRQLGETGNSKLIPPIRKFLRSNDNLSHQARWSSLLALSRLGDSSALDIVLSKVKGFELNDDVVEELFPDLIYTRQRRAIDHLIEALFSDQQKCTSSNPENPNSIKCGYRIVELLAPVIQDFPISLDAVGELNVKDYESALLTARDWLKVHPNYIIVTPSN